MSENTLDIRIRINYPTILFVVLLVHALFIGFKTFSHLEELVSQVTSENDEQRIPIRLQDIRTAGSRESKIKSSTYLSKSDLNSKDIAPVKAGRATKVSSQKQPLSLSDLSVPKTQTKMAEAPKKVSRPGTRPEVLPEKPKAINAISLKGPQIREFMKNETGMGESAAMLSGDPRTRSLNNSDVMVNLEVPEGVHPDELNQYELMFYGFQRRTAINYVNSFYKNLDKFQRENPHLRFPMTETRQIMTGRLTYDEKGNIKQIKMIRWTNVDRLQSFFEGVLKDMDTLHNPPKPLWSKNGEFSIFFSLVING